MQIAIALSLALLTYGFGASSAAENSMNSSDLKKIQLLRSNNSADVAMVGPWIQTDFDLQRLRPLRSYVENRGLKGGGHSELEFVKVALSWVTEQWDHDGMNEPPKDFRALDILKEVHEKKARYRCVEYGLVLNEVLQAFGFYSRKLSLKSKEVGYGAFGQGHVATEVWLNELGKWIFVDPQFGAYLTLPNSELPLNFYEAFHEKQASRWDQVQVHFVSHANPDMPKNPSVAAKSYKDFLKNYFGSIATSAENGRSPTFLLLESGQMPLTFQGQPSQAGMFLKNEALFYPEMNKVFLSMAYEKMIANVQKMVEDLKIKTDADYLRQMPKFAAVPNFEVRISSDDRFKSKVFEYRLSPKEPWKKAEAGVVKWHAHEGSSRFEARARNELDRPGPVTYLEVEYK